MNEAHLYRDEATPSTDDALRILSRGTSLSYLVSVAATLATLGLSRVLFNVIGNNVLGVPVVGKANVLLSLALLAGLPASAGMAIAMSRFVPIFKDDNDSWRSLRTSSAVAIGTVGLVLLPMLALSGKSRSMINASSDVIVVSGWSLLYAQYALGRAVLFAKGLVTRALTLEILGFALFGAALGFCAWDHRYWWLPFGVYPIPIASIALSSFSRRLGRNAFGGRREFFRFAGLALLGSTAAQGIQYGSTLAGAALGGVAVAGVWATLVSLSAPVLLLPRSLNTFFLPRLSLLSTGPDDAFRRKSIEHQRVSTLFALPAMACLMLMGSVGDTWIFPNVSGIDARALWNVLCLTTFVTCRGEPILTAIAARGAAGINASAAFVGALVCSAGWYAGHSAHIGLLTLALGVLLYSMVVPISATLLARYRKLHGRPRFAVQPGDVAAIVSATLFVFGRNSSWLAAMALLVAGLGFAIEVRRFFRRPAEGT